LKSLDWRQQVVGTAGDGGIVLAKPPRLNPDLIKLGLNEAVELIRALMSTVSGAGPTRV